MTLYMGIDLGWKSFRYEVRDSHQRMLKRGGGVATPEGLRNVLQSFPDGVAMQVAYEAGSQMHWVNRVVEDMKKEAYAFHAGSFYLTVKSKKKTDKKDAEAIACAAAKDNLPSRLYMPPANEKRLRSLLQEREDYKGLLNGMGNRLHALAVGEGFLLAKAPLSQSPSNWEEALQRFSGLDCEPAAKRLYASALALFQQRDAVEEEIQSAMDVPEFQQALQRLQTIPGVGYWTATSLVAYCGPRAARFASSRKAASYFGMTPSLFESGQKSQSGHITKCGPPLTRRMLVQAAWSFLRSRMGKTSLWGEWYQNKTKHSKKQKKTHIIGLARKILTAAVAMLQNETEWNNQQLLVKV